MDRHIAWLLEGDASVRYMAHRDLLHSDMEKLLRLQADIAREGIAARLLSCQNENGHWGIYYYQPKWTSTHYTLLELKALCLPPSHTACGDMISRMFDECMLPCGSMNLSKHQHDGDICVDGMILNYAAYFRSTEPRLDALCARLLSAQKADGGFAWDPGATAGEAHTTICVLEGLSQYASVRRIVPAADIARAEARAVEFLLSIGLFFGADSRYRKLTYPHRYRYDLLRALKYFAMRETPYNERMLPAVEWLRKKSNPDGRWKLEYAHPGNTHFEPEPVGEPSRFITLFALTVDSYFSRFVPRA
jgi:hypothetical protein